MKKGKKKPMPLKKAIAIVSRYQGALAPSLGRATMFNTVALAFFNPGLSLGQAMEGAEQIAEAEKVVRKHLKERKANAKGVTSKHRLRLRRTRTKAQRQARRTGS